jgi:hypothetical protein
MRLCEREPRPEGLGFLILHNGVRPFVRRRASGGPFDGKAPAGIQPRRQVKGAEDPAAPSDWSRLAGASDLGPSTLPGVVACKSLECFKFAIFPQLFLPNAEC